VSNAVHLTRKKLALLVVGLGLVAAVSGCTSGSTSPATNVNSTSATLNGTINRDTWDWGQYWFEYSSNGGSTWTQTPHTNFGPQNDPSCGNSGTAAPPLQVSYTATGLTPSTTYVYRLAGIQCPNTPQSNSGTFDSQGLINGTAYHSFYTRPATPTFTGTTPASPADDNSPEVRGTAGSGTTVKLYASSDCTGSPVTGTAALFASPGFTVSVPDNSTTTYSATATDGSSVTSACSAPTSYSENTQVGNPVGNLITNWSFESNTSGWEELGTASTPVDAFSDLSTPNGSKAVKLTATTNNSAYSLNDVGSTVDVDNPAGSPAGSFGTEQGATYTAKVYVKGDGTVPATSNIGKQLTIKIREWPNNGSTPINSVEASISLQRGYQLVQVPYTAVGNGNELDVQAFRRSDQGVVAGEVFWADAFSLTKASVPVPPPPTLNATQPTSPANNNSPKVTGSAQAGSMVKLYAGASCSGNPLLTAPAADLTSPGLTVSVPDNSRRSFSATASNASGTSSCSSSIAYSENTQASLPSPNLTTNSTFTASINNWEPNSGSLSWTSEDFAPLDNGVAKAQNGNDNDSYSLNDVGYSVPVSEAGTAYTAKVYVRGEGVSIGKELQVKIREWTSPQVTEQVNSITLTDYYQPVQVTYTAEGGHELDIQAFRPSATVPAANEVFYADGFSLTKATAPAPVTPTVGGTTPTSPAANTAPAIKGTAAAGSTVSVYTNSACTGTPSATGNASTFNGSTGIPLSTSVHTNSQTTFWAKASNTSGTSPCSTTSVSYSENTQASIPGDNLTHSPSMSNSTSTLNDWEGFSGSIAWATEDYAPSDNGVAKLQNDSDPNTLSYSIGDVGDSVASTQANATYTARVYVRGEGASLDKQLQLKIREWIGGTPTESISSVTLKPYYQLIQVEHVAVGPGHPLDVQAFRPSNTTPVAGEVFYADAFSLTETQEGPPSGCDTNLTDLAAQGCTVIKSDLSTNAAAADVWGNIDCADSSRHKKWDSSNGGTGDDPHQVGTGGSQVAQGDSQHAYRELHIEPGDNVSGQRCELGRNEWRTDPYWVNPPFTFHLYEPNQREITFFSYRIPPNFPAGGSWQVVMQMKHTNPNNYTASGNPGVDAGPPVGLQLRDGQFIFTVVDDVLADDAVEYPMPVSGGVQPGRWYRFAIDVTYSNDESIGRAQAFADLDGDGNASAPYEHTNVIPAPTLREEYANSPDPWFSVGDPIPSHLRLGLYNQIPDPAHGKPGIDCGTLTCRIDIDNVQVVHVSG
jgi:hypothetical protein